MNLDMSRRKRAQGWMVLSKLVLYLNSPNTVQRAEQLHSFGPGAEDPGKAQHEFEKGLGSLAKQDVPGA